MNTKSIRGPLKFVFALFAGIAVCTGAQLQLEEPPAPGGGGVTTLPIPGTVFTFTASGAFPPCTSGTTQVSQCQFLNDSGQDWTTLRINVSPGTEPAGCSALFGFNTCSPRQGTPSTPSMLFFSGGAGIPDGMILAFSGSGWPSPTVFNVSANVPQDATVPEPSTMALAIAGFGLLCVLNGRRRAAE